VTPQELRWRQLWRRSLPYRDELNKLLEAKDEEIGSLLFQIDQLKVEIEVLHEALGKLDIYTPRLENQILEKDAEIQRLKEQLRLAQLENNKLEVAALDHKALCTRAADALEQFDLGKAHLGPCPVCNLIAQLRKAAE
jgi:DNA repair exonuclease SbcCD ATPase subunit